MTKSVNILLFALSSTKTKQKINKGVHYNHRTSDLTVRKSLSDVGAFCLQQASIHSSALLKRINKSCLPPFLAPITTVIVHSWSWAITVPWLNTAQPLMCTCRMGNGNIIQNLRHSGPCLVKCEGRSRENKCNPGALCFFCRCSSNETGMILE